jgi:putative addiction module CopG family antidote
MPCWVAARAFLAEEAMINIHLPNDVNEFVRNLVVNGRYESEEAVIAEGLRLLMSREQLRAEVAKGVKQLDAGDWIDGDAVFAELDEEIDRMEAENQGT